MSVTSPFTEIYCIGPYISAMCCIYHCLYGTLEAYKFTSSATNFIFIVRKKVWQCETNDAGKAIRVHKQGLAI